MSELEDQYVKLGFWINWSQGPIMGQTYTVDGQTGITIVALLSILASVATAQLWNLFTFFFHQIRADGDPSDGLFWQHQALLRTMPTPTAFMADSLKLSWKWRSKVRRPFLRSSLLLTFALCSTIASIAGSISTSWAVDNSNIEVLVNSPLCGRVNYTKVYAVRSTSTLLSTLSETMQSYAANCYQNSSSLPAPCRNTFSQPNISFTAVPASCPWNTSMCDGSDLPAVAMDTGLFDMKSRFGLNVEEKDNVKMRKRTVCNVLPRDDRIITRNVSYWTARHFNDSKTTMNYGSYRNTPAELRPEATFLQSTALTENQPTFGSDAIQSYLLPDESSLGINPLPEMERDDADVALSAVWLNDVDFEQPANDALFSAHKVHTYQVGGGYPDYTRYAPDYAGGVVGCSVQYQFCIPRHGKEDFCTKLSGSPLEISAADFPDATPLQLSLLQLLRTMTRLSSITIGPTGGSIQASKTVFRSSSPGVADDQWIKEVVGWEALAWTGYQTILSASVIGPKVFDDYGDEYTDAPDNAGDKQLCQSLKMRKAGGFANINVFALVFLTTFSAIILLFNLTVLRFFIFLSRFRRSIVPRVDRWVQDGVFQLQRRAFEAQLEGRWVDLEKEIPTTQVREKLFELPIASLPSRVVKQRESVLREREIRGEMEVLDGLGVRVVEQGGNKNDDGSDGIEALDRMDSELTLKGECGMGAKSVFEK